MLFTKTRKFFTSLIAGFLAQTDSPGTPEGKKRYKRTTPVCTYCLMEFEAHSGDVKAISESQHDIVQHHVQHCPSNPLVQKFEATTEALRQIECMTNGKEYLLPVDVKRVHELAYDGYGAGK